MQIIVNSLLVHYENAGSGKKTVLLLHGWGDSSASWHALQQELANEYRVIAIDLPGFGNSQVPPDVWHLQDYANFVKAFLEKLEVTKLHAVIGHSNGGSVAIKAVSTGALQPEKVVLLASAGVRDTHKTRRLVLKVVAKTGKVATFWLPGNLKQKLRRKLYGAAGSDLLVVPHLQETFKVTVREDVQADAANITVPTLLVYGEQDTATPAADGQKLAAAIKGAKFVTVQDAGHFVFLDQPAITTKTIKEFLS